MRALVIGLALLAFSSALKNKPRVGFSHVTNFSQEGHPGVQNCTTMWFEQNIDHFSWKTPVDGYEPTFKQRFFVCDSFWERRADGRLGPIFFYVGNEADVELYVNASGLMWESAPQFGALLVFAEHRYYGKSLPFGEDTPKHMEFLSSEQALADFATLIRHIRTTNCEDEPVAVVGFGGSYGGMLATWLRMKYPAALDGAIAGSAPIWSFLGEAPAYDYYSFAKIVTRDASAGGGSPDECAKLIKESWAEMFAAAESKKGRQQLAQDFMLCEELEDSHHTVWDLAYWVQTAFDYMSMGNFPYPSSYILNGDGELPAFPMREACNAAVHGDHNNTLEAVRAAVAVFYNYTQTKPCFNLTGVNPSTEAVANYWDFQWCTEMFQPFARGCDDDMFFAQPFNETEAIIDCQQRWKVTPRPEWAEINYAGRHLQTASNIVFSNGLLDPWSGGGVLESINPTVVAVVIPEGAHHLDLMFSHPLDPPSVTAARETERKHISAWVEEVYSRV